jgi:hypothetical protein
VPLARLVEALLHRARNDVDVFDRHIRIEGQRYRGVPDLFGNREIASAVAVALAK